MVLRLGVALAVTVACLAWALGAAEPSRVVAAVRGVPVSHLVGFLAIYTGLFALRAYRFGALLESSPRPLGLFSIAAVGFLAIVVVPFRLGELMRPYLLAEEYGGRFGAGVAAVAVERLLDLAALLALLAWMSWGVDLPPGTVRVSGFDVIALGQRAVGLGVLAGLAGLVAAAIAGEAVVTAAERAAARVGQGALAARFAPGARSLVDGLGILRRRPGAALWAALATAMMWAGTLAAVALVLDGLGIEVTSDLLVVYWAAVVVSVMVAPTPGAVGPFEAGGVAALTWMGVDGDVAVAVSALDHGMILAHSLLVGVSFLAWEGWSFVRLVQGSRQARP